MDRLDRLEAQARAWKGNISVALYLPDKKGHPGNISRLADIRSLHEKLQEDGICDMSVSLLYANHSQDDPNPTTQVPHSQICVRIRLGFLQLGV